LVLELFYRFVQLRHTLNVYKEMVASLPNGVGMVGQSGAMAMMTIDSPASGELPESIAATAVVMNEFSGEIVNELVCRTEIYLFHLLFLLIILCFVFY
jgi:hypothetical protein